MQRKKKIELTNDEFFLLIRNAGKRLGEKQKNMQQTTDFQQQFEDSNIFYDIKRDWSYPLEIKLEN